MDIQVTLGIVFFIVVALFAMPIKNLLNHEPIDWRVTKTFSAFIVAVAVVSGICYLILSL